MGSPDQLVEINREHLPLLRDLYKPNTLRNYIAYMTIDIYVRLFEREPHIKLIHFYCLNGDFSNGTFIVTDRSTAVVSTFHESSEELFRLLLLIDYSKGYLFIGLDEHFAAIVRKAIKQRGIEFVFDDYYLRYVLAKEKALEFNVQQPVGINLKRLTNRSDIEKAYSVWPANMVISVQFFIHQVKYYPSVGTFMNDGTLGSWVLQMPTGMLLALQTDEKHYGKGYGTLVAKAISKQIAQSGYDLYAGVAESNTASRRLFEKLGFENVGKLYAICTKLNWTEDDFIQ